MSLKVVCFCSYLATINLPWRQEDWGAYKFVHALKGHELNGYCHVPVDGILRRLSSQNLSAAIDWYAKFALAYLTKKKISTSFVAVPVPNSDCTVRSGTKPHTLRLAKALCELVDAETAVMDCLRWKRNLGSASQESGPRDAGTLYKNLAFKGKPNERVCAILVDDVMTGGGHLQACAAKLREAGAVVPRAFCGGRTTHEQDHRAFELVEETLQDFEP